MTASRYDSTVEQGDRIGKGSTRNKNKKTPKASQTSNGNFLGKEGKLQQLDSPPLLSKAKREKRTKQERQKETNLTYQRVAEETDELLHYDNKRRKREE